MRRARLRWIWMLGLAAACAATPARQGGFPVLDDADTDPAAGYERPPTLAASEHLGAALVSGPHHRVREEVRTNGFLRIYTIDSDFGEFQALGDFALRLTLQEIRAIAALRELGGTPACEEARAAAREQPFVERWELVTHPCDSVHGVPPEAWRDVMRIAELRPQQRTASQSAVRAQMLDFEATKRRIARRLGVSPYSLNRRLQAPLNEITWLVTAGSLPVDAVPLLAGEALAPQPQDVLPADRLADLDRYGSPEDLRRRNHIELAVMGLDGASIDAFLSHPAYSPRQQTGIVEALVALDPARDRSVFVEQALRAELPGDSLLFLMNALLLSAYHQNVAPVERLLAVGPRGVAALTAERKLMFPVQVDYLLWSRPTERFLERLVATRIDGAALEGYEVWIGGEASPRARAEFQRRGVALVEGGFERAFRRLGQRR